MISRYCIACGLPCGESVSQCPDACAPFLWLHGRPRRECGKKYPAHRSACTGPDGAFVEPKGGT